MKKFATKPIILLLASIKACLSGFIFGTSNESTLMTAPRNRAITYGFSNSNSAVPPREIVENSLEPDPENSPDLPQSNGRAVFDMAGH